jgi:hypothetical protein
MVTIGGTLGRIGKIGGGFLDVLEAPIQLTMDLVLAPVREDEYEGFAGTLVGAGMDRFGQAISGAFGPDSGLGAVFGAIPEQARSPFRTVVDPVLDVLDWTYDNVTDRALSTAFTMARVKGQRFLDGDIGSLLDLDDFEWAWEVGKSRSAGQAWAVMLNPFVDITDSEQIHEFVHSEWGQLISGTFDAVANVWLDPADLLVGKIGLASRAGKFALVAKGDDVIDMATGVLRGQQGSKALLEARRAIITYGDGRVPKLFGKLNDVEKAQVRTRRINNVIGELDPVTGKRVGGAPKYMKFVDDLYNVLEDTDGTLGTGMSEGFQATGVLDVDDVESLSRRTNAIKQALEKEIPKRKGADTDRLAEKIAFANSRETLENVLLMELWGHAPTWETASKAYRTYKASLGTGSAYDNSRRTAETARKQVDELKDRLERQRTGKDTDWDTIGTGKTGDVYTVTANDGPMLPVGGRMKAVKTGDKVFLDQGPAWTKGRQRATGRLRILDRIEDLEKKAIKAERDMVRRGARASAEAADAGFLVAAMADFNFRARRGLIGEDGFLLEDGFRLDPYVNEQIFNGPAVLEGIGDVNQMSLIALVEQGAREMVVAQQKLLPEQVLRGPDISLRAGGVDALAQFVIPKMDKQIATLMKAGQPGRVETVMTAFGKPVRLFKEFVPQRWINFAEDASATEQFDRMLRQITRLHEKLPGDLAALLTEDQRAALRLQFQTSDSVGRAALFDLTSNRTYQEILKRAGLNDDQAQVILKRIKNTQNAIQEATAANISFKTKSGEQVIISARDYDSGSVIGHILPYTQQQIKNVALMPRFDMLVTEINKYAPGIASSTRRATALGLDTADLVMSRIMKYWRASALLRPAWAMRVLPDEMLRAMSVIGLLGVGGGVARGMSDFRVGLMEHMRGIDTLPKSIEGLRTHPAVAMEVGTPVIEILQKASKVLDQTEMNKILTRAALDESAGRHLGKIKRVLKPGLVGVGTSILLGPMGGFAAAGLYSRMGYKTAGRLAEKQFVNAYGSQMLRAAEDLLKQAIDAAETAVPPNPALARQLRQASDDILTQYKDTGKILDELGLNLSDEASDALTLQDRVATQLHNLKAGHIRVGNRAIDSAFGTDGALRQINMRAVSASRATANLMGYTHKSLATKFDDLEQVKTIHGTNPQAWDHIVNRQFRGYGSGRTTRSKAEQEMIAERLGLDVNDIDEEIVVAHNEWTRRLWESQSDSPWVWDEQRGEWSQVRTEDQIVDELHEWINSREAAPLADNIPWMQNRENIVSMRASVNKLLPDQIELVEFRRKLADGNEVSFAREVGPRIDSLPEARAEEIRTLMDKVSEADAVQANGTLWQTISDFFDFQSKSLDGFIERAFASIGGLPTDNLVRNPFFRARYEVAFRRRVQSSIDLETGELRMTGDQINEMQNAARTEALKETRHLLYDLAENTRFGELVANIMPFYGAWQEVISRWVGITVENPAHTLRVLRAYRRAGAGTEGIITTYTDDDGDEYWVITPPESLRDGLLGTLFNGGAIQSLAGVPLRFSKSSANMLSQGLPGFGPVVGIPVNELVMKRPDLEDAMKIVLPFGVQSGENAIWRGFGAASPAWARRLVSYLAEDESYLSMQQLLLRDTLQKMEIQNDSIDFNNPEEVNELLKQIEEKAQNIWIIRGVAALVSPIQPLPTSPFQAQIDKYRKLQLADPESLINGKGQISSADEIFLEEEGDEFFYLTARFTRNNTGIPATLEGHAASKRHADLIAAHPRYGRLIVGIDAGGSSEFSNATYRIQQTTETSPGSDVMFRERLGLLETAESVEVSNGWQEYRNFMDIVAVEVAKAGCLSINDPACKWLRELKGDFIFELGQSNKLWFEDYRVRDSAVNQAENMTVFRKLIADETINQRSDIEKLAEYVITRDAFSRELARLDVEGGSSSLFSRQNQWVLSMWDDYKEEFLLAPVTANLRQFVEFDSLAIESWPENLQRMQREVVQG